MIAQLTLWKKQRDLKRIVAMKNGSRRQNNTPIERRIACHRINLSGQLLQDVAGSRSELLQPDQLALRPEFLKKIILRTTPPTSTITMSFLTPQEQSRVSVILAIRVTNGL